MKSNNTYLINDSISEELKIKFQQLSALIDGDLYTDKVRRLMYATDASAYRELPLAVCRPKNEADIIEIVKFASKNALTLIPRTAGTSLAGQVVGRGLVLDLSKYMTRILKLEVSESKVTVQPGVVLDELNKVLYSDALFFSPETSTSTRCMIGGMIGNNSSGLHSVVYGTTREHVISMRMVLSDGSIAEFSELDKTAFEAKCELKNLEGDIYRNIRDILGEEKNRNEIRSGFPDPDVVRRNTGYAMDELLQGGLFDKQEGKEGRFNFCKLLAGSEGTLGIMTEATLHLDPLPPKEKILVPVHMNSVKEAIQANLIALKHKPAAIELMDQIILDLTEGNISQNKNRFFIEGHPGAILIVEFVADTIDELRKKAAAMETEMRNLKLGYHFPIVSGSDIPRVWNLRKAGLGVLSGMKGDFKPVPVIEDTSVSPNRLEEYIDEFDLLLKEYNLECVYYAHISVGELHLRPVLNLKDEKDVELFHTIALEVAKLVKKYRGSISGEHGDGRLRGEFIPLMMGEHNFALMRRIKDCWDPEGIFNRNKIIDTPPMNTFLRHDPNDAKKEPETIYDFSGDEGILRHIEKCNGSGDCRKTEVIGGTMCPSYMAGREEWNTTRARANILREFIGKPGKKNLYDHKEVYEILDLCLSCKACKSECPSSVDMAKLKSEFMQHWYDAHGIPLRTRLIAYITSINKLGRIFPSLFNFMLSNKAFSTIIKRVSGFAKERSMPLLSKQTVNKWASKNLKKLNATLPENAPSVYFFVDEFTEHNDAKIGIIALRLLHKLGVRVNIVKSSLSGRTFISKGLIRTARKHAVKNVQTYRNLISGETPLIGTEPSAILSFRDEYPDLVGDALKEEALKLSKNVLLFEEYVCLLKSKKLVDSEMFTKEKKLIKLHGHCQQKAIASTSPTIEMLTLPANYKVSEIPSGCCGMAGSFGYEREHYALSMKVGELVLFPEVRKSMDTSIIAAAGTSCRHQIKDGTDVLAEHPVEILWNAIK